MPTRYLKPGICDSPRIERIATPAAEILYYRLLVTVDDYGRFDARAAVIKGRCFPLRRQASEKKIIDWLRQLHDAELLVLYMVSGDPYLQITKWVNTPRATSSRYPEVPTTVCNPYTVLPVTVTGTGTGTETETETGWCLVGSNPADPVNGDAVVHIPLINGTEWGVSKDLLTELERAYPAVDGPTTLREIRAWCLCNPKNCKTAGGVKRFLNRWFEKEQNRG